MKNTHLIRCSLCKRIKEMVRVEDCGYKAPKGWGFYGDKEYPICNFCKKIIKCVIKDTNLTS